MCRKAIEQAKKATCYGVILGTLGRQGNPAILTRIEDRLTARDIPFLTILLSEISPAKLARMTRSAENPTGVDAWVQIACPRLSIDWGGAFGGLSPLSFPYRSSRLLLPFSLFFFLPGVPLLNAYEALVALGVSGFLPVYPMDYYAKSESPWSNYYTPAKAVNAYLSLQIRNIFVFLVNKLFVPHRFSGQKCIKNLVWKISIRIAF